MIKKLDKRIRADLFRRRLSDALRQRDISQSILAQRIGVDRSTISQLVNNQGARLPNAQVIAECATALGVSADWLLGLSERRETAADILAHSMSLTEAPRALVDEQIFAWHQEAAGYKIRHVPAGLPDMLKTRAFLEWEYAPHLGRSTDQAVGASEDRLNWMRKGHSDYEIAMPIHELVSFAHAEGYYRGLSEDIRRTQLNYFRDMITRLYPKLRVILYDARRVYSAPVTVFGPMLAVVYVGRNYMAFRDTERVRTFTDHFDYLLREAALSDRDIARFINDISENAM